MNKENSLNNTCLSGLLERSHVNEIIDYIDKIKPLAVENKFEEIKNILSELGKYKNLVDIDIEVEKIKTSWNTFGISDEFYETLELFRNKISSKVEKYVPIQEKFREYFDDLKQNQGISFLNRELDKITGGLLPGSICSIVGGPGSMKTTTAMNIAYRAIKQGKNVCYFSLEETPAVLYSKLLSRVSVDILKEPILVSDILRKEITEENKKSLFNDVKNHLDALPGKLYILGESDIAQYTCFEFENKMREINELVKETTKNINENISHEIDLVIIDHVQLLKYASGGEDEFSTINKFVSFFRRQALSFLNEKREISIILLSQVNREGIKYAAKHDGEYLMQHVAESSEIERASAYIISVYTDAMVQITKQLKIGVLKLRNGTLPTSTFTAFADGSTYVFGDTLENDKEYNEDDIANSSNSCSDYSVDDLFASGILDPL